MLIIGYSSSSTMISSSSASSLSWTSFSSISQKFIKNHHMVVTSQVKPTLPRFLIITCKILFKRLTEQSFSQNNINYKNKRSMLREFDTWSKGNSFIRCILLKRNVQNEQKILKLNILLKVFYWPQNLSRLLEFGRIKQKIAKLYKKWRNFRIQKLKLQKILVFNLFYCLCFVSFVC